MASSTIVTDLTIHTAHIRLRSGKYMLVYYTNEYDEDGNPINITIYDSSETLIENPPYEIVYEVTKTIPPPEGDWLNNLWFKNGVNSLSPRQSPGQTNNIFLGFETAENFDLSDLVTYSGDYNFIAGYQLASSLTTGNYNTIFGRDNFSGTSTSSYLFSYGFENVKTALTPSIGFAGGFQNAKNASDFDNSFFFGDRNNDTGVSDVDNSTVLGQLNVRNATDISDSFISGYNNGGGAGFYNQMFINGSNINTSGNNLSFGFLNGSLIGTNLLNTDNLFANGFGHLQSADLARSTFVHGRECLRVVSRADYNFVAGYRNIYNGTGITSNVISIGFENGFNAVNHSNSIYLGYRQGYTTGAANRLFIGMAADDPLLSGHFTSDWIRVDGYLEVRDKSGVTSGNIVVWDGDKLVDSGSAITSFTGGYWRESAGVLYSHETSGTRDIIVADLQYTDRGNTPVGLVGRDSSNWLENIAIGTGLTLVGSTLTADVVDDPEWTNVSGTLWSDYNPGSSLTAKPIRVGEIFFEFASATASNAIMARNASGYIAPVTIGSGLSFSSGILSASGSSLWTDSETYYRPNNLSNLASNSFRIYDTGRVTIGGTSDPTPYLLSVNGIGRFTSGVSLNGDLEFTNSSDIVFDSGGSGNIVDTNGVSGSSGKFLGHDGGGVAWVDAPGYTPTYATSTGNADTFTTGTYVNINGASTTYTIPVTEVLAVWCSVIILGGSSGANVTVSIRKNSSIILISRTIFVEAGVEKNISLHSNDDFNSGDTLRIHCSTSGSGFETVSTNTTWITVT